MNKVFLYILFFAFVPVSFGQTIISFNNFESDSNLVKTGIILELNTNSNVLTNQFLSTFYAGKYITKEIKDGVKNKLGIYNHIGGDFNSSIYFSMPIKKIVNSTPYHLRLIASISDREHFNASFPSELFELIFYGNKRFDQSKIALQETNFTLLRYQQIQLGLLSDNGMGRKIGASISYLNGEQQQQLLINKFDLYSSNRQLSANWDIDAQQSNPNNQGLFKDNGWGFSTHLFYQYNFQASSTNKNFIQLEIHDLGFINWYNKSIQTISKDSLVFNGIEITDFSKLSDSTITSLNADSLSNQYLSSEKKAYTTYLPARFTLQLQQTQNEKFQLNIGMSYRINANYIPYIYWQENYRLNNNLTLSGKLNYGGYARFFAGAAIQYQLKNWNIRFGTNTIDGFIFAKKKSGISAFIGIHKTF